MCQPYTRLYSLPLYPSQPRVESVTLCVMAGIEGHSYAPFFSKQNVSEVNTVNASKSPSCFNLLPLFCHQPPSPCGCLIESVP